MNLCVPSSRADSEHSKEVVRPYDWTYTTDYRGTLIGEGTQIQVGQWSTASSAAFVVSVVLCITSVDLLSVVWRWLRRRSESTWRSWRLGNRSCSLMTCCCLRMNCTTTESQWLMSKLWVILKTEWKTEILKHLRGQHIFTDTWNLSNYTTTDACCLDIKYMIM